MSDKMNDQGAKDTSLLELARSIPEDLRCEWETQWYDDGTPCGFSTAPIGAYVHRLANELEAKDKRIAEMEQKLAAVERTKKTLKQALWNLGEHCEDLELTIADALGYLCHGPYHNRLARVKKAIRILESADPWMDPTP